LVSIAIPSIKGCAYIRDEQQRIIMEYIIFINMVQRYGSSKLKNVTNVKDVNYLNTILITL